MGFNITKAAIAAAGLALTSGTASSAVIISSGPSLYSGFITSFYLGYGAESIQIDIDQGPVVSFAAAFGDTQGGAIFNAGDSLIDVSAIVGGSGGAGAMAGTAQTTVSASWTNIGSSAVTFMTINQCCWGGPGYPGVGQLVTVDDPLRESGFITVAWTPLGPDSLSAYSGTFLPGQRMVDVGWPDAGGYLYGLTLQPGESFTRGVEFSVTYGAVRVPEPLPLALLGLGLFGIAWTQRRRLRPISR